MHDGSGSYAEVEAFLNDRDNGALQRREHHLPREAYRSAGAAFCVTRCARRHGEPFRDRELASAVIEALQHRRTLGVWRVYAYCLMPDHLHAVVQLMPGAGGKPPRKDLLQVMGEVGSFTTRQAWDAGLPGRLWQHDQYDRLLRNDREFDTRCRYVLNNPVRKGWVEDWSLWPYSGILDEW